jgi:hypothetical protein
MLLLVIVFLVAAMSIIRHLVIRRRRQQLAIQLGPTSARVAPTPLSPDAEFEFGRIVNQDPFP